ncbi:O-antigen ligase family protein [Vreelandella maris]|jgi:O-antigen ligase|uniref:O-antigen ligase family protein n=1 Tax=Vreelandella maris TaxID=2729617 RepID=A0A7Y6RBA1_9GAMM|nr:O-antigen ligase family protein [Halomonas maris]NVF13820.1 O-antigen ligase family protein [Halomonas maris]|tara:strand:- start:768 stop:2048 length:1281 start_codon:yes stop_codon:yes gene_type:complete
MNQSPLTFIPSQFSLLRGYTSFAVLLLGAVALIIPSGYSIGAVLLLLGSIALPFTSAKTRFDRRDWLVASALFFFAVVGLLEAWSDGQGLRGADKPLRFLLAIPVLALILAYPPRLAWLWSGLALGGIAVGGWGAWQKLVVGVERAGGYTHVIQFGNISMLTGILCLAGMGWAVSHNHPKRWLLLLGLGAIGGVLGSLFSGSRGGWVGLPIVLWVLYRAYGRDLATPLKIGALAVIMVGALCIYSVPQLGVQQRVHQAVDDIERYVTGESRTSSVGARFEMWKGASHLIMDKPILGWGHNGYQQRMQSLAEAGVIDPGVVQYEHAHNEFVDTTAKRGALGLLALLVLYLLPLRLFMQQLHAPNLVLRSLAVAGALLPVTYIDFGLSQAFLTHNSGVMIYTIWLAVLWGSYRACQRGLLTAITTPGN